MTPKTFVIIVLLAAAAVGSWYAARSNTQSNDGELPFDPVHHGYYLKDARILGTGDDGKLLYEIDAEHAEQQEDNSIEFTDVRIRYSPDQSVPWVVKADNAVLIEDETRIALRGHVQITNNTASPDEEAEIRTQYLELDPERFIAETDARVQIRFGERSLTATGMLASLHDDRIELRSNVRGKIAP